MGQGVGRGAERAARDRGKFGWARCAAVLLLAATAWAAAPTARDFGGIHFAAPNAVILAAAPPWSRVDFRNFTYQLFPTEAALDLSKAGVPPLGPTPESPLAVPVRDGVYVAAAEGQPRVEFQILKTTLATLPRAPEKRAAIVFAILYVGALRPVCTGVVQVLEPDHGAIKLADQFTFDCRGGLSATYEASKRRLHIASARFAAGDPPCCPTLTDSADFKLEGDRVKAGNVDIPGTE